MRVKNTQLKIATPSILLRYRDVCSFNMFNIPCYFPALKRIFNGSLHISLFLILLVLMECRSLLKFCEKHYLNREKQSLNFLWTVSMIEYL